MKKFMKKLAKKSEGFTLVELIVVIAILGILAGVAVPAYSGYLTKAHEAADETVLGAIKTAAQAYRAEAGGVGKIDVTADDGAISSITVDEIPVFSTEGDGTHADPFMLYLTGDANAETLGNIEFDSDTYEEGAYWNNASGWSAGTRSADGDNDDNDDEPSVT